MGTDDTIAPAGLIQRMPTHIWGLDAVLQGGLIQGATYLVTGPPGAGKSILANHLCFNHVAAGGRAIYVTLLGAEHAWMLSNLQSLAFFKPEVVGASLHYFNGYAHLEKFGLAGLRDLVRQEVRTHQATLVLLDGLVPVEVFAESQRALHQFIRDLQVASSLSGCTTLLLGNREGAEPRPENALVDGILELRRVQAGPRVARELEVSKFRGGRILEGTHFFEIDETGIVVYPRTEALLAWPSAIAPMSTVRMQFGIPRLDEMLGGGLLAGSTTMLLGASGSGKTPLGAAFLSEGAQQGQPGLHFGFYETPSRLIGKTDQIGLDFGRQVAAGMIEVVWRPPVETTLDRLGHELLTAVSQHQAQRLFIDGLDGFQQAAFYTERLAPFLTALSNELRGRGITTIFTVETGELFDPTIAVPVSDVSAAVDNILVVRTVQTGARLHRLIAIMKMRASRYDTTMREFLLTDRGIEIAESLASAEAILADPSPAPPADPLPG